MSKGTMDTAPPSYIPVDGQSSLQSTGLSSLLQHTVAGSGQRIENGNVCSSPLISGLNDLPHSLLRDL